MIKSVFSPVYLSNPYQSRLAAELRAQGVEVELRAHFKEAAGCFHQGGAYESILHLHWLPKVTGGIRNRFRVLKFRMGLRQIRRQGAAIVWTVHNLYHHECENRVRERTVIRDVVSLSDGMIVHSQIAEAMVRAEFDIPNGKVCKVIPHGNYIGCYADSDGRELRRSLGAEGSVVVYLFLGNIRPYKGVTDLIGAFAAWSEAGVRLLIAGKPLDEKVGREVELACRRDSRVVFHRGHVPDDRVASYLRACDAVVLPYMDVLTSGAAVLAMSFGKPCVAPRIGCLPEALSLQDELLYAPGSIENLTRALERAFERRSMLSQFGKRNLDRVREWDWGVIACQTAALYRECLGRRTSAGRVQVARRGWQYEEQ